MRSAAPWTARPGRTRVKIPGAPEPLNAYQAATSTSKLRGQFYTPEGLVELIFRTLDLTPQHQVVDPACGDGRFLAGALAEARRRSPSLPAEHWLDRVRGFDIDPEAVSAARERLRAAVRTLWGTDLPADRFQVTEADLLRDPTLMPPPEREPLILAGNPPYVEAKRLDRPTKAALQARYPEALSGAPDLYLYFLHVCLERLQEGDQLALVLPNKLLVSSNALALRRRLVEGRRLAGVWFATQTAAFEGAGVYPIVLFARPGSDAVEARRILKGGDGEFRSGAAARLDPRLIEATRSRAIPLVPEEPVLRAALERLLGAPAEGSLREALEIRWTVSFHRTGLRERYTFSQRPDRPHARPFIGGGAFSGNGEVARYRCEWAGWWIDYDADALSREGNHVPSADLFRAPKIAICQNGRTLRAAYDESGAVLKDTFLCGVPLPDHPLGRHPRALVGLLNSRAVHFFYAHVFYGGHVAGGYLHFLRSFLEEVPAGAWTDEAAAGTAALVEARERAAEAEWEAREEAIETRVSRALGLSAEEAGAIRAWAEADPNWTARERIRRPR